jgi:hypothetical protein
MSQFDETFKAQKRVARKLSTPHMRALRKELLIARADVERMEISQAASDLRYSVKHFSFLKLLFPGRSQGKRWGKSGSGAGASSANGLFGLLGGLMNGAGGMNGIAGLLRQYPIVGSLASVVLTKPVRTKLLRGAKPLLKWGGLGLAGWEAFRVWQQMKTTTTETSNDAVDPTIF